MLLIFFELNLRYTGWGGQSWTRRVIVNVQYRPTCLIEAYFRPEKYWLVCSRLLANHLLNLNLNFLSDGVAAAAEEAQCIELEKRSFRFFKPCCPVWEKHKKRQTKSKKVKTHIKICLNSISIDLVGNIAGLCKFTVGAEINTYSRDGLI